MADTRCQSHAGCYSPFALLLLLLLLPSPVAPREPEVPLPEEIFLHLEQILQESASRSWRVLEEDLKVEEARAESEVQASGSYPTISGSFRYLSRLEERSDFDRTRRVFQPQAGITLRQPLYHWGAVRATSRIGRIQSMMAESSRAEVLRTLALEIRSSYLELAVQAEAIALAETRHNLAEREREAARASFRREEITAEEEEARVLAAEEAALRLDRTRRDFQLEHEELSRLTGLDLPQEWLPATIPELRADSGRAINRDHSAQPGFRPRLDYARSRLEQAEQRYEIERVRNRPRLNLVAGVSQDQVPVLNRDDIDRTVLFAGVEVTWNLFDGFESRGRRAAALARKRLEKRREERQEREWTENIGRLHEALEWSARELALAERRFELSRRSLNQRRQDLERGRVSELELTSARVSHGERRLALARARADHLMTAAELLSEAGHDPVMEIYLSRLR